MTRPDKTKVASRTVPGAANDARPTRGSDDVGIPAALPGGPFAGDPGAFHESLPFGAQDSPTALPRGSRLAEFELLGLIGEGGFGIVYLAYDTLLRRRVALKEYLPGSLAARVGTKVLVRSSRQKDVFATGMRSFINEARLLARFDHPSLVKVYRFWEANGTAYMVMPYYEGMTLEDSLRAREQRPDETWLRALLEPLVDALCVLHEAHCYHRDIAPDNIILLKGSERPVLLDFGAARHVIADKTQALTVIFKPGYAPVEQYAEVPSMRQGPWTDVYALAAVVYFAIQGHTPPPSMARYFGDSYVPLETAAAARYSAGFLRALDHGLAVQPADRPQGIAEFAEELGVRIDVSSGPRHTPESVSPCQPGPRMGHVVWHEGDLAVTAGKGREPGLSALARHGSKRIALIAGAALVVTSAAGGAAWWFIKPSPAVVAPLGAASMTVVQNDSASPNINVLALQSEKPQTSARSIPSDATVNPPSAPPAEAPSATLPAYTPDGEMERIVALADPSLRVVAQSRHATARIDRDYLQFTVTSSHSGFAYVFMVDPNGQYVMLFPNQLDTNNAIAAAQKLELPRSNWQMTAGAPPGPNVFLVIVSALPRDFSDAGLRLQPPFADIPADAQRIAALRRTPSYSPFAGKPRCARDAGCLNLFGAATFRIDVVHSLK
jgi:serine/threonine protein kinase